MSGIAVAYFDGRRATPHAARLSFDPDGQARVEYDGLCRSYRAAELQIGDRVGQRSPRRIEFPDGAIAHVEPDAAADELLDRQAGSGSGWLRRMEARWPHAVVALALCVVAVLAFVRYGLPAAASAAADRVPPAVERQLGERAFAAIDEDWLAPSALDGARRESLRAGFRDRIAAHAGGLQLRLEFRSGEKIGPNAFALPGGIVVVTDELVLLARQDDEVLMVLAHEVGHVAGRHSLRQLFEGLGLTAVLSALTGDLSGPASLAAALPAVLAEAAFSRRDEREADAFAFAWADAAGVPRTRMTDLLQRIEEAEGQDGWPTYLSTHPATEERANAARAPR
ncbi:MAG: M48 family metallopeptidase [Gammaproteobacteria bacterium]